MTHFPMEKHGQMLVLIWNYFQKYAFQGQGLSPKLRKQGCLADDG